MDVSSCHLDGNADAVEFCPHPPFLRLLAAATYTLGEGGAQPSRSGSVSLFSVDSSSGLQLLHRVHTAGVFDIKWNPGSYFFSDLTNSSGHRPLLAQADANGCLALYSLQSSGRSLSLVLKEKASSSMCLCLDWSSCSSSISIGLSDGWVSILAVREDQLQIRQSWAAHKHEVWSASFDSRQPHLVYTGSDDCCFSCWDLRQNPSSSVFRNSKSHKMGVCCIAPSPIDPNMLLTGSYDEFLRLWDVRNPLKPVDSSSLCLGGGVWRLKHHPSIQGLVLAACMHNGFAIVKIDGGRISKLEEYNKHESLAYGADWQRGEFVGDGSRITSLAATCSFYDKSLRIWQPQSLVFP